MSILTATAPPTASNSAGKLYRLGRIFGADGRTVVLPVDHGTMLGRVQGLEDPAALLETFLPLGCDGFLLGPGLAARTAPAFASRNAPARLLTVDSYWRGEHGAEHVLMTSMAHAAALGVDAVKVLMPWDVPPQERAARIKLLAQVIAEAEPFGLPVMAEPICLANPRPANATQIEADGARMAAELGADIIKVMAPEDPSVLTDWSRELGLPIVILGGPAAGTTEELLEMVEGAIAAGARGITIGRKVWQRPVEDATELLVRLAQIVHPDR